MKDTENALAPIEFIVSIAAGLMLAFLVIAIPATIFGSGSFLGLGDRSVCQIAPQGALGEFEGRGGINEAHVVGARPGVSTIADTIALCDSTPSSSQRLWSAIGSAADFCYALGFLGLAWWLIRTARSRGLFSPHVALGVGRLGLYVLLGSLAVAMIRAWSGWRLLSTMDGQTDAYNGLLALFHLSWPTLFAGFGLLTVGRVMAQSVRMQREIDATV